MADPDGLNPDGLDMDVDSPILDGVKDAKPAPGAEPAEAEQAGAEAAEDPAVSAAADRMLAQLAIAETVIERDSRLGALQLRLTELSGGWGPIVLASVGGVVLLALGLGGLTLLGLLL